MLACFSYQILKLRLMKVSFLFVLFGILSITSISCEPVFSEKIEERWEVSRIKDSSDCAVLTRFFELKYGIPNGLLLAIAKVESRCQPWAVNHRCVSKYFKNMDEAAQYVSHLEKTHKNISIGFMQINWPVHRFSFSNLTEAFTPYTNVQFAAELLCRLYKRYGSWEMAVCWYNPKNKKPNLKYWKKVQANWIYIRNS